MRCILTKHYHLALKQSDGSHEKYQEEAHGTTDRPLPACSQHLRLFLIAVNKNIEFISS